jgi:hypothetical protein
MWQVSLQQLNWVNTNLRLITAIDRMEVWRLVVVIIHPNDNAEETANLWHYTVLLLALDLYG